MDQLLLKTINEAGHYITKAEAFNNLVAKVAKTELGEISF